MGSVAGDTASLSYPPARRDESVVDTYHGVQIPDPCRWMEDPDSEETKEFVARQAELVESVLAGCSERESLHREVTRLFNHPRHAAPFRRGDKYFYFHNSGLQAQSVLYVQTGKSKHYGFIEFENPEVAKIVADEMNNYLLFEHTLQIAPVPLDKVLFVELRRMSRPLQRPRLKHGLRGNFRIGHSAPRGGRFPYACPSRLKHGL